MSDNHNAEKGFQDWQKELAIISAAEDFPIPQRLIASKNDKRRRDAQKHTTSERVWILHTGYSESIGDIVHVYKTLEAGGRFVEEVLVYILENLPTAKIERSSTYWAVFENGIRIRWFHMVPYRIMN